MENPDADGSALGFLIFLFFNLNFQLCALLQCNRGISRTKNSVVTYLLYLVKNVRYIRSAKISK